MQIAIKCLYLIPLTFYLLFAGCEKDFAPISKNPDSEPVESKLHLDLIDTDVREAWLRLTVDSTFNADTIEVTREQYIIYRDTMMVRDTVIYDYYFPLTPDPVYYYRAYAKHKGRKIQITEPQEAQMLPVTSHNYTWEIDTIGTFMSILEGVWGTAPDNVYAVGTIYLPNFPPYNSTRIVHWDGKIWQPLNFDGNGPEAIFGFSDSDFWIAGDWGSPSTQRAYIGYWNGTNWQHWQLEFETLKAIWGTSSSNMYAVGVQGEIIHFDGASWTSMPSGTDYLLNDIWGTSENDIYITGRNSATGEGILLKYDEGTWEKIYDGHSIQGIPLSGQAITIWGQNPYKYYLLVFNIQPAFI